MSVSLRIPFYLLVHTWLLLLSYFVIFLSKFYLTQDIWGVVITFCAPFVYDCTFDLAHHFASTPE